MNTLLLRDYKIVSLIGIIGLTGYIVDTIVLPSSYSVTILNIICVSLTLLSLCYHWIYKPEAELSLSLFAIILIGNLIIAPFLELDQPYFTYFYLRNSLIFWVIMPLLGLTIHRNFFLATVIVYLIQYALVLSFKSEPFLINSTATIALVLCGYVYVVLYMLKTLQESRSKAENLIENLREKNIVLNEQKQELNKLIGTKNKLFSIIAHDLQSPFMGIAGLSEMINESAKRNENKEIAEYSEMISDTSVKTSNLLLNLLDWAKSQKGDLKLNPQQINLDDFVDETISLMHDHRQRKQIELKKNNTDILLYADPNCLKTVLRNLLSNALKFTPESGSVSIFSEDKNEEVLVAISDTGIGIEEEHISRIFDENSYFTTKGTSKEKGSGIGLSLCKDLINRHNGKMWVESEKNKGTTFYFTLPKQKKAS